MTSSVLVELESRVVSLLDKNKTLFTKNNIEIEKQKLRYLELAESFFKNFEIGDNQVHFLSAPGRTEVGGNHTDHNNGKVLAAAVNLDTIAFTSTTKDNKITVYSKGYSEPFFVNLEELSVKQSEAGTTTALIRGIASRMTQLGYQIGGFNAYISSEVLKGSGLSSSASIEVLLGNAFNHLYNNGTIEPEQIAMIGQYAENEYFLKPCGLMDQMACAVGGFVTIDFEDPKSPVVNKIDFSFSDYGLKMLVVDSKDDHADLTDEYASIPIEMKSVAKTFDKGSCREFSKSDLLSKISSIRKFTGDRAVLRAMHFHAENERVDKLVSSLKAANVTKFLELISDSGNSSWKWLQNCISIKNSKNQGLALALAVTEDFIINKGYGACRVHGGGFAGTIQVFLAENEVVEYIELMESVFGERVVTSLNVRQIGMFHTVL